MASLTLCTVCLEDGLNVEPIYSMDKSTALDVYLLTGVKIIEIKNMKSALICTSCLTDLSIAKNFRNRCKRSENLLKNLNDSNETKFWEGLRQNILKSDNTLNTEETKSYEEYSQVIKVEPDLDFASEGEDYSWNCNEDLFSETKTSTQSVACPYCSKMLHTKRSLKYHIQVKHELSTSGIYKCDFCGKAFPNKHPLKRHIHQTHNAKSSKYVVKSESDMTCLVCKVVLKNRKSYRNHVKNKHPTWLEVIFPKLDKKLQQREKVTQVDIEECPCAVCGKVFKNKRNLSQHEKTHKIILPHEYFYCDLCGNKFKEKILMWAHIKKRHIQKIRYQCDLCPCSYTTNHSLQIHIKVRHKNIRDWICNWCGKDFGEKKKLVAHERIHTGEQPYHCHICDAKFTHQTDYRRHKWNHEGRKSFKCQICGEGFVKRSELISHKNRLHAWRNQPQLDQFNSFPPNIPPNMPIN